MQSELKSQYPLLRIEILAINELGQESQNNLASAGRVLPLLQDVDANQNGASDVWASWDVEWRDVRVLNQNNVPIGNMNLTVDSLATTSNYELLKAELVDAAMANQLPWKNASRPLDVNNDGSVVALDVLLIINTLNQDGNRKLPPPTGTQLTAPFYDTNGDGRVTPIDALLIINDINSRSAGEGEMGEGEIRVALPVPVDTGTSVPIFAVPEAEDALPVRLDGVTPVSVAPALEAFAVVSPDDDVWVFST